MLTSFYRLFLGSLRIVAAAQLESVHATAKHLEEKRIMNASFVVPALFQADIRFSSRSLGKAGSRSVEKKTETR